MTVRTALKLSFLVVPIFFIFAYFAYRSHRFAAKLTDGELVQRLKVIQAQIQEYYNLEHELPNVLADLRKLSQSYQGERYQNLVIGAVEYQKHEDGETYSLCARFSDASAELAEDEEEESVEVEPKWDHPSGPHCFRRRVFGAEAAI